MKENRPIPIEDVLYHCFLVKGPPDETTFTPAYITATEVKRIESYGGLANTPKPITVVIYTQDDHSKKRIQYRDILAGIVFNKVD